MIVAIWPIRRSLSDTSGFAGSVFAETRRFRAAKSCLEPVFRIGTASLGVRPDGIPNADPFVESGAGESFHMRAGRPGACFRSDITLSALLNYRFGFTDEGF